ncbi:helix-turn-helix transcriptional regulator [Lachnoclostridium sp. MSJ-17]|uniref:helix-turn-helix transcriptional regulator n=1 Tax=Lachnoclostridium sp. MSJ-17 TaxID=2841516 RepID=UPI001C103EDD|nr:helix-turn-helix transcriptional regulator [Lachnoclostridium sp. MSJ-17]
MTLNQILTDNHISKYRLSKNSGVPYMTINDICSGKTNLAECSAKTIYKLAKELRISMEELLEPYLQPRAAFDLFKSNVCHRLKELGDIPFLIDTLESDDINTYYRRHWYPECLYLLAMVDYVSRENNISLCEDYNELRRLKLPKVLYPNSVIAAFAVSSDEDIKRKAEREAIPEFMRFNIVESEVRNVV